MEATFYSGFSKAIIGQTVSVGALLPIIVLLFLLLFIVVFAFLGRKKNGGKPLIRPRTPTRSLSDRNEELKQRLAEMQARNAADLAQTRAILAEAQSSGKQVVKETREGVIQATREETQRAKADIIKAREEHLAELRREGASIGQDEPPSGNTGQNP